MEWQRIESAPKDGSEFLAYTISRGPGDYAPAYHMEIARWMPGNPGSGHFYARLGIPTHWMPLPPPPAAEG